MREVAELGQKLKLHLLNLSPVTQPLDNLFLTSSTVKNHHLKKKKKTVLVSYLVFNALKGVKLFPLAALITCSSPFLSSRVTAENPCTEWNPVSHLPGMIL